MKLYIFYRVKNALGKLLDVPELYGFTTKKKIHDEFIEQRNMDIFHLIKKDLSSDLTDEFIIRYKEKELHYQPMYTRNEINPMEKKQINVLTTWNEIDKVILKTDIIFTELSKYVSPTIIYLKDDIIQSLDVLYYTQMCKFMTKLHESDSYFFSGLVTENEEKDIIRSNLDYDEFALYMFYVAYTYK